MSELFQTEESLSPELQWLSEAKRAGIATFEIETEAQEPSEKWSALAYSLLSSWVTFAATELEAVDAVCLESGRFPTFDQWKLERAKR